VYIALGLTGCIGAYKALELIRRFQQLGHEVQVAATRHALEFVTPLSLETLSRHPLVSEMFQRPGEWEVEHIALARRAEVLCVAPTTANCLAKFAQGIADDFLSTLYLSTLAPVVVAPAMNHAMWRHPATRQNVAALRARGVRIVEPGSGYLACGEEGAGRLAELPFIVEAVLAAATPPSLAGRTVLITAGPTVEDLDPVRYLTNRSSGKMGFAVARIAARRGARVILVSGPTAETADFPCELVPVRSAAQMAEAVLARQAEAEVLVMAAAVADYTPAAVSPAKLKKGPGPLELRLVRTVDILSRLGRERRPGQILVGFAAETEQVEENARRKLLDKGVDLMVANRVGPDHAFGRERNTVTILGRETAPTRLEDQPKDTIAARLWDLIQPLLPGAKEDKL